MVGCRSAHVAPSWSTGRQLAAVGVGQVALLAVLAGAGLGRVGLVVGALHLVVLLLIVARGARRCGLPVLGPADLVTAIRAALGGGCAALASDGLATGATSARALVAIATIALVLDALDGRIARSTGTVSAFGARFDMEVDAFLLLVLSAHATAIVGWWVLAIGAMRYAFAAAGWLLPWLRGQLPSRRSAKAVAAAQGVVLVVVAATVLPPPWPEVLTALALIALAWSFALSITWLWQHRSDPD
ncbi:CDP-alcohol phosphatidyltransferase family protein [Saccharopolyspora griseoalba]|uniref:CDP-alcohol phosphatidyltransferase family protein n=1 Tax=Saccharopolyspora griseoalba TaxID=1431848 RepID=A0ABW2LNM6_9PSEU